MALSLPVGFSAGIEFLFEVNVLVQQFG